MNTKSSGRFQDREMSEVRVVREKAIAGAALLLAAFVLMGLGWFQLEQALSPVDPQEKEKVEVVIPPASSTSQVAEILKEQGLIRNKTVFLWYCRLRDVDQKLKAGTYGFSKSQGVADIVEDLVQGRVMTQVFTVPEGYDLMQIGRLLADKGICDLEEFKQAVREDYDYPFLDGLPYRENRLEGFLFPDTYRVPRDVTPHQVVDMMLTRFEQVWKTRFEAEARQQGRSVYEVVTLASLVEKEARIDEERPIIAGVLENRLRKGMLLQVDATVLYSLGEHRQQVTYKDLEVDSPYNTYRYPGLPPGPIASPGAASIAAVLNPARHDYYYYVYVGDGRHYFSKTYEEHLRVKNSHR